MKKISNYLLLIIFLLAITACNPNLDNDTPLPGSQAAQSEIRVIADGWTDKLPYEVPKPGTYTLSNVGAVGAVGGGPVLGVDGEVLELENLFSDKIVLLTFIYSSCTDLNGCPLATAVFYKIKERFKNDPKLADKIRLIRISFDPEHDTPEVMKLYGAGFEEGDPQWLFLTTAPEQALKPVIEQYGQMVIKEYDDDGNYTGTMAHVLRAFLIDRSKNIRQEYSVSFLHDQLVATDIKTLLIEDGIL